MTTPTARVYHPRALAMMTRSAVEIGQYLVTAGDICIAQDIIALEQLRKRPRRSVIADAQSAVLELGGDPGPEPDRPKRGRPAPGGKRTARGVRYNDHEYTTSVTRGASVNLGTAEFIRLMAVHAPIPFDLLRPCDSCAGSGAAGGEPCSACRGTGYGGVR